ncbi:DUF7686 domain-containing protein [Halobacillus trueperi]|uniref:Uncharacterized protein n=1 Tax=Halobacillus trueperi TaxID=156205 RepID=A0A3E0J0S0_9BACI|nr:hypothetical protein [Halobacillus trueperi]REJ06496.1 hypothetical protein DYE48_18580 [Halobacillus trueperi]
MGCEWCEKRQGNVHTEADGESVSICMTCYNQMISEELGVDLIHHEDEVYLKDDKGVIREFSIQQKIDPLGIFIVAEEKNEYGYSFSVFGELGVDQHALFHKLIAKVKNGISTSYVEERKFPNGELYQALKDGSFMGQIEAGEKHGEPFIIIDGKPYSWHEVGRMLYTYEGR